MDKPECSDLVSHIYAAWGRELPMMAELKSLRQTWWLFVHDLDYDKTMAVVNKLALTEKFIPKPGELRCRVIVGTIPDALESWEELQAARQAVNSGSFGEPLSEITKLVMSKLGETAAGLHTNGDRGNYVSLYEKVSNEWLQNKCQVIPPPK